MSGPHDFLGLVAVFTAAETCVVSMKSFMSSSSTFDGATSPQAFLKSAYMLSLKNSETVFRSLGSFRRFRISSDLLIELGLQVKYLTV